MQFVSATTSPSLEVTSWFFFSPFWGDVPCFSGLGNFHILLPVNCLLYLCRHEGLCIKSGPRVCTTGLWDAGFPPGAVRRDSWGREAGSDVLQAKASTLGTEPVTQPFATHSQDWTQRFQGGEHFCGPIYLPLGNAASAHLPS